MELVVTETAINQVGPVASQYMAVAAFAMQFVRLAAKKPRRLGLFGALGSSPVPAMPPAWRSLPSRG